jgi:hypothetical protein
MSSCLVLVVSYEVHTREVYGDVLNGEPERMRCFEFPKAMKPSASGTPTSSTLTS